MKKIIFLVFTFLFLAGCSPKYPMNTHLKLDITSQAPGIYNDTTSAALKGHDARKDSAVVTFRIQDRPEIRIPNKTAPHILVAEQLAAGLQQQGLIFAAASPVHIELNIDELLATVTRPKILYTTTARSLIRLTIKNRKFTLTRSYDREANQESVKRPRAEDLEKLLNDQLAEIVQQILLDKEVQTAINQF